MNVGGRRRRHVKTTMSDRSHQRRPILSSRPVPIRPRFMPHLMFNSRQVQQRQMATTTNRRHQIDIDNCSVASHPRHLITADFNRHLSDSIDSNIDSLTSADDDDKGSKEEDRNSASSSDKEGLLLDDDNGTIGDGVRAGPSGYGSPQPAVAVDTFSTSAKDDAAPSSAIFTVRCRRCGHIITISIENAIDDTAINNSVYDEQEEEVDSLAIDDGSQELNDNLLTDNSSNQSIEREPHLQGLVSFFIFYGN